MGRTAGAELDIAFYLATKGMGGWVRGVRGASFVICILLGDLIEINAFLDGILSLCPHETIFTVMELKISRSFELFFMVWPQMNI